MLVLRILITIGLAAKQNYLVTLPFGIAAGSDDFILKAA